jgi:hypothetical protein
LSDNPARKLIDIIVPPGHSRVSLPGVDVPGENTCFDSIAIAARCFIYCGHL